MHDGKTCVEAGYKNITSLSQCEYAFLLVPEHPEERSYSVSWRHCTSFVIPASIWMVVSVLSYVWPVVQLCFVSIFTVQPSVI